MNPKVYVLTVSRGYDDYSIVSVFATEYSAKAWMDSNLAQRDRVDYQIEEWDVEG